MLGTSLGKKSWEDQHTHHILDKKASKFTKVPFERPTVPKHDWTWTVPFLEAMAGAKVCRSGTVESLDAKHHRNHNVKPSSFQNIDGLPEQCLDPRVDQTNLPNV